MPSRIPPGGGGGRAGRALGRRGRAKPGPFGLVWRPGGARRLPASQTPPPPRTAGGAPKATTRRSKRAARLWLSKKWLAPLFRGVHSSLAPTARPGSYARKPLLRKAFCGFDAHVAKSDYNLRGLRPPNPRGFFDRLRRAARKGRRASANQTDQAGRPRRKTNGAT